MRSDRAYMALVGAYREVYSRLGEEFSEIDKTDDWFLEYEMPHSEQQEVLDLMATKYKLTKLEKRAVESSYWMGCAPKDKKDGNI